MASFQAKIGCKRFRKFQKNCKKIQNYYNGFISSKNRLEKAEKERK